ncbi:tyrosine-type recombinase/integrase [Sutcliffiella horikoshii]|uniref:tyrosine-type recombinase/integrase n=1 Tax=Sutcliffiella horikoshii TaxID=79883 RepID=UPI003CEE0E3A
MNTVQPIRDKEKLELIKLYFKERNERDYVMFMVGIYTGLRIYDILKLKIKDVSGTHIIMREKKTKKEKRIIIIPELKRALRSYIRERGPEEFLLKSQKGKNRPIGRSAAYRILNKAAREFNLSEIGTHTMRKTFGYHFYHQSKDVSVLMKLFNHSDQKVTLRYIGVEQDTLDNAMMKFKYN